jgi:hypothetical protein
LPYRRREGSSCVSTAARSATSRGDALLRQSTIGSLNVSVCPLATPDAGLDDAGVEVDDLNQLAARQAVQGGSVLGGDSTFVLAI